MTTVVKVANTSTSESELYDCVITVGSQQAGVEEVHHLKPGEEREVTIYGDRSFSVAKRYRDVTPEVPNPLTKAGKNGGQGAANV